MNTASNWGGFSSCGAQALGARASVVAVHRLSSCGSQALECMGFKQLAGGFVSTAMPGKSHSKAFLKAR